VKFNSTEHAVSILNWHYQFITHLSFLCKFEKITCLGFLRGLTGVSVAHAYHEHCLRFVYFVIFDDDYLQL